MALARTQYVRSGDVDIAYQVIGDGPRDLVLVFDWASHLEALPELPALAEFILELGRFARVLWFDMQGSGMSGSAAGGVIPVESWMDDLIAVMDAGTARQRRGKSRREQAGTPLSLDVVEKALVCGLGQAHGVVVGPCEPGEAVEEHE